MRVILSAGKKVYFTLLASSISAFAQCAETDCNTLGYDSTTACDNGIKCPFGEYWACPEPAKPEGAVLGQCTGYAKNCKIADILYTDGTCSADVISGKTPIAVVVYIGSDNCGQALALESLENSKWSTEYVDIPNLANYENYGPRDDFKSCENTKTVIDYSYKQYGDNASEYYPAFWKVYNYAPSTMLETKGKWCLPSAGMLESIYWNKTAINQSLTRINKENIINGIVLWWSSSEANKKNAWSLCSSGTLCYGFNSGKLDYGYVRPVIEF